LRKLRFSPIQVGNTIVRSITMTSYSKISNICPDFVCLPFSDLGLHQDIGRKSRQCYLPHLIWRPCWSRSTPFDFHHGIFRRPFVKRFALCYRSVVCPVLSVTLVHCGQTVGWIKMKLGMLVGLGPGHIVLDGDPVPLPQRGTAPDFRPISVVAKWLYESRCHLVRR